MPREFDASDLSAVSQTQYGMLRIIGGWGNASGPSIMMFRSMIAGTTTAAVVGITASVLSALIIGSGGLAFILGSSLGFFLGSWRWYRSSVTEALNSLDRYPLLMRMHLQANYGREPRFKTWRIGEFSRSNFGESSALESMLVASWLTAQPALDEIQTGREAKMVEGYIDGSAQDAGHDGEKDQPGLE